MQLTTECMGKPASGSVIYTGMIYDRKIQFVQTVPYILYACTLLVMGAGYTMQQNRSRIE